MTWLFVRIRPSERMTTPEPRSDSRLPVTVSDTTWESTAATTSATVVVDLGLATVCTAVEPLEFGVVVVGDRSRMSAPPAPAAPPSTATASAEATRRPTRRRRTGAGPPYASCGQTGPDAAARLDGGVKPTAGAAAGPDSRGTGAGETG